MMEKLFTSESVTEGHPDKVCDAISDAVLDEIISSDPGCRVACETLIKTGLVLIAGEITTSARVKLPEIARRTISEIGYRDAQMGLDPQGCSVLSLIEDQSPDISAGVDGSGSETTEQGAGDQGMMFGYACDQTPEMMPLPIILAHRLAGRLARVRKEGKIDWLRPDGKTQVTVRYCEGRAKSIDAVLVSAQHAPDISQKTIEDAIRGEVMEACLPRELITGQTRFLVNPTGRFVVGGPRADTGITGRKIMVDTYGGWARHGGGAFSGKDPSKVDRSAAYFARYIAKNIVAAKLARSVEVQLAYAIGVADPVATSVTSFGTARVSDARLNEAVRRVFDCRPERLIGELDLLRPIYRKSASYGHFGRDEPEFSWERTDRTTALIDAL